MQQLFGFSKRIDSGLKPLSAAETEEMLVMAAKDAQAAASANASSTPHARVDSSEANRHIGIYEKQRAAQRKRPTTSDSIFANPKTVHFATPEERNVEEAEPAAHPDRNFVSLSC